MHLADDGNLKAHRRHLYIGNVFAIDRMTVRIVGQPFYNPTARKIEIITQGDAKLNFEVLPASSPNGRVSTDLVIVLEWVKGSEKPFVGLSSGSVYSGTCR